MTTKKPSRAERRQAARDAVKLARARTKLAAMEAGGAPDRPIDVPTASLVEPHAASLRCAACGEAVRVIEHAAVTTADARRLRVAHVQCAQCGVARAIYFRIGTALPS
jgi:hypothetical protein